MSIPGHLEEKGESADAAAVQSVGREALGVLALSVPVPLQPPWSPIGRATSPRSCCGHSSQGPVCP